MNIFQFPSNPRASALDLGMGEHELTVPVSVYVLARLHRS